MIASTNLVIELGVLLYLLLGWQFVAGQLLGEALMIAGLAGITHLSSPRGPNWHCARGSSWTHLPPLGPRARAGASASGRGRTTAWPLASPWVTSQCCARSCWPDSSSPGSSRSTCRPRGEPRVPHRPRWLDRRGGRRARAAARGDLVRLLRGQYPTGRGTLGQRRGVRWRDQLHLRGPRDLATTADLPTLLRDQCRAATLRTALAHDERAVSRSTGCSIWRA
jgi:hypothetical protein